jgi:hypothetical protein
MKKNVFVSMFIILSISAFASQMYVAIEVLSEVG